MPTFNELSIAVPTFREAENVPHLVRRLSAALEGMPWKHEIVLVDDDSRDGIDEAVRELQAEGHRVRLIVRQGQRSLSSAVVDGFRAASPTADVLLCMDADLSHEPESVPALVERLEAGGCDFVIGSRYVDGGTAHEGWSFFRALNSRTATLLSRPFTRVGDPMSGFFALPAERFRNAGPLNPCGYKIGLELIVKCGCTQVCEVPITFCKRFKGRSKLSLREQANYVLHLRRLLNYKYPTAAQVLNFAVVGVSGMLVDFPVYALLLTLGTPVGASRALAIWAAMTWNWWFNRCLTFGHTRPHTRPLPQYLRYALTNSFGAVISWSVAVVATKLLDIPEAHVVEHLLVAAAGVVCAMGFNFTLSKLWVFRHKAKPSPFAEAEMLEGENVQR